MDMSGRVAVVGMGQMGSGMAGRLRDSGLTLSDTISAPIKARAFPRTAFE